MSEQADCTRPRTLLTLPNEVLQETFAYLDPGSASALLLTNKQLPVRLGTQSWESLRLYRRTRHTSVQRRYNQPHYGFYWLGDAYPRRSGIPRRLVASRLSFLQGLARDQPDRYLYCSECEVLHARKLTEELFNWTQNDHKAVTLGCGDVFPSLRLTARALQLAIEQKHCSVQFLDIRQQTPMDNTASPTPGGLIFQQAIKGHLRFNSPCKRLQLSMQFLFTVRRFKDSPALWLGNTQNAGARAALLQYLLSSKIGFRLCEHLNLLQAPEAVDKGLPDIRAHFESHLGGEYEKRRDHVHGCPVCGVWFHLYEDSYLNGFVFEVDGEIDPWDDGSFFSGNRGPSRIFSDLGAGF